MPKRGKKKSPARRSKVRNYRIRLDTGILGHVIASRSIIDLPKVVRLKTGEWNAPLTKFFQTQFAPAFRRFFSANRKKGIFFLASINYYVKVHRKRVDTAFSLPRRKIRSNKDVEFFLEDYLADLLGSFQTYMRRKDFRSIAITGWRFEVIKKSKEPKTWEKIKKKRAAVISAQRKKAKALRERRKTLKKKKRVVQTKGQKNRRRKKKAT